MPHKTQSTKNYRPSTPKTSSYNEDPHRGSSQATKSTVWSFSSEHSTVAKDYSHTSHIDNNITTSGSDELAFLAVENLWQKPTYDWTHINYILPGPAMHLNSYLPEVGLRTNTMVSGFNNDDEYISNVELSQGFSQGIYDQTEQGYGQGSTEVGTVANRSRLSYPMEKYLRSHEKHERLWK